MRKLMYDIGLIVPLFYEGQQAYPIMEYQGFTVLKAYLKDKGYIVKIIDAFAQQLSFEEVLKILVENDFKWLGFTIMSSDYLKKAERIVIELKKVKRKCPQLFLGGIYATLYSEEILMYSDTFNLIVLGDGEKTIEELLEKKDNLITSTKGIAYKRDGIVKKQLREQLTEQELNQAPMPIHMNLENVIKNGGIVQVITSRGCYGSCQFCAVNSYMQVTDCLKWRALSAERVVKEIEDLYQKYKFTTIDIADDNFIGFGEKGRERAKTIARMLIERGINIKFNVYSRVNDFDEETFALLKKAGMNRVFIGIEFGVQSMLDFYKKSITVEKSHEVLKKLKEMGIKVAPGYIMFEPMMSITDLKENLAFYYENCDFKLNKIYSKLEIYKKSSAYNTLKNYIKIRKNPEFHPVFGDVCEYRFLDAKVEKIFEEFSRSIPAIMPSKSFQRILDMEEEEMDVAVLKEKWASEIYNILQEAIEQIDKEIYMTRDLEYKLVKFDNDFYHELGMLEL